MMVPALAALQPQAAARPAEVRAEAGRVRGAGRAIQNVPGSPKGNASHLSGATQSRAEQQRRKSSPSSLAARKGPLIPSRAGQSSCVVIRLPVSEVSASNSQTIACLTAGRWFSVAKVRIVRVEPEMAELAAAIPETRRASTSKNPQASLTGPGGSSFWSARKGLEPPRPCGQYVTSQQTTSPSGPSWSHRV